MPESPDIPEEVIARIRDVMPYSPPVQQSEPDRNEPMPYQRPDGKDLIDGEDERGFAVTPVPKSTSGTIGSFVGQVSVSPDTLLNDFPDDMDGQTPKILSVSDATEIYAHATVDGAGVVTARVVAAGASVPDDDPESGDFYWHLASVTMAAGGADNVPVITVDQIRWGPIEELQRYYREFHIQPSGAYRAVVYNGTLFGQLPTGFSVDNNPFFELTGLANGDKIYAKVTWNRTLNITGDIVSTITTRTIEAAAAVPANDPQTATRHYQLATVTLGAGNIPVIAQSRWGPIDDLPGTARYNYAMNSASTTAQTDYWDLLATGKGKQAGGVTDLAPSYDSVQVSGYGGWLRFIQDGTNLKIFSRGTTMNSVGQITYIGPEYVVFNRPVVCETTVDVLVGLRLDGTELQGQYKTITVNASATASPEWRNLIPLTASGTTIDVS